MNNNFKSRRVLAMASLMATSLLAGSAMAAGKYAGRIPDITAHQRIVTLRGAGQTIKLTAKLVGCSESQVKRIWAIHRNISHHDGSVICDNVNHSKKQMLP